MFNTDFYALKMAGTLIQMNHDPWCVMELHVRESAGEPRYWVAAGLDDCIRGLVDFEVRGEEFEASADLLAKTHGVDVSGLEGLRPQVSVNCVQEGTILFPPEPALRLAGPLSHLMLVESYLLGVVRRFSYAATAALRIVRAAGGRPVSDYSLRRANSIDHAYACTYGAAIAGFSSTSNVAASARLPIPLSGTMSHAFVLSFPSEYEAFSAYAKADYGPLTLLIDTYDTLGGARTATSMYRGDATRQFSVRIDSGDLVALVPQVIELFEREAPDVKVLVSGGLDDEQIRSVVKAAPDVDGFGVGTFLASPTFAFDLVLKLVQVEGMPVMKHSIGKESLPGVKEVYRMKEFDLLALRDANEAIPAQAVKLMRPAMSVGVSHISPASVDATADYVARQNDEMLPGAEGSQWRRSVHNSYWLDRAIEDLVGIRRRSEEI